MRLSNKIVVITGAASGIGRAMAEQFAAEGAGVGEVTDALWDEVLRVNLQGPMYASRRALATMLSHGSGVILNVASIAGLGGGAAGAAYTTSKHALIGLTRNTAWMYALRGIRCNAICPGATRTNIADSMPEDRLEPSGRARAQAFAGLIPAWLESADIAALALFLASDAARRVNGAIITADGGWTAV